MKQADSKTAGLREEIRRVAEALSDQGLTRDQIREAMTREFDENVGTFVANIRSQFPTIDEAAIQDVKHEVRAEIVRYLQQFSERSMD